MNTSLLRSQGEALLPAIAYGDAAGLPVETRSAEYINERYGRIDHLVNTADNDYFAGVEGRGGWSDDTQLSVAVAEGLLAAGKFDLSAQATTHIAAYNDTPLIMNRRGETIQRGWGGSTIAAVDALRSGVDPLDSGIEKVAGNGVLMKMAPLVLMQVLQQVPKLERYEQYDLLTTMTHDDTMARRMTRLHGDVLHDLATKPYSAERMRAVIGGSLLRDAEARAYFSYLREPLDADTILENTDARGFHAPQTLAMAYGAFMMHDGEFAPSVYEAVNLGGDTDSTASIVAAMSTFATKHALELPADAVEIKRLDALKEVSARFTRSFETASLERQI